MDTKLKHVDDEIRSSTADLEQRVAERTAEFLAANALLRSEIAERKRTEDALRKSERVLREAEALGHTGSWEHNLVTGEIFNTPQNLRLFFGDDPSKGEPFEDYAGAVHPDDREFVMQRHAELLEGGPGDIEYRVVWPNGNIHVIFGRATVVRNDLGQPIRIYGTNVDVTERKQVEETLRQSESNFRTLAEKSLEGIQLYQGGRSVYANAAMTALLGYTAEELTAMSMEEHIALVHPLDRAIAVERARRRQAGEDVPVSLEVRLITKAGDTRWVQGFTNEIEYNGQAALISTAIDITERKRAEDEILHQAARAETLVHIAARLNEQLDLAAVIQAVCEEVINTFKVSQATMSLYDQKRDTLVYAGGVNIPPEYAASIEPITRSQFDDFLRALGPIMVVPDIQAVPDVPNARFSSDLDVRTVVTAAMMHGQELVGVLVVGVNGHMREFTESELTLLKAISDQAAQAIANAQLLKAANEQQEQLRALSAKLVEVQESERKQLARELHDDISQALTASMMQLGTVKNSLPKSAKSAYTILEQTEELIENTLERTRSIIAGLRPQVLDDLGLVPALRRLGDELHESSGTSVDTKTSRLPRRLPAPIEVALFRIVQEALANIRRHAEADHVTISLAKESDRVTLSVQDDGVGFEMQTNRSRQNGEMIIDGGLVIPARHFGLIGIQERVTQLDGKLEVSSSPGQGTTLRVELPL